MTSFSRLTKAFHFAAEKHVDQRRKGAKAEPYVNHVIEVANLLAQNGADETTVIAGVLHDTVEDTKTTFEELEQEFGQNIAGLVREVTDDKSLPKLERKRLQIEHAAHASDGAKMIKLADKSANLRALLESPPPDWEQKRITEYFTWAKSVVDGCRGVNAGLEKTFDDLYARGMKLKP
jgi:guanosine-3',5'-bis(diphosphate) 3'-pyrophosphohydrolase